MPLKSRGGWSWIEVLLWLAIIGIIASFVLRIVFGRELREVESNLFGHFSIGSGLEVAIRICIAVAAISLLVVRSKKSKRN